MTGLEICALIMTTIRDGTTSNWFTETFRVGKAFSRTRKLSMPLVMLFLMFKTKASMPNEIDSFLHRFRVSISEILGKQAQTFTKQALSKARKGIDIKAFEWLVTSSVNTFFAYSDAIRTWCNLLVFAVDGTDVQLPQRAQCFSVFGAQRVRNNGRFPMAKGSLLYCVSIRIVVDAILERCKYSERELAMKHMSAFLNLPIAKKSVVLFDRGYFSLDFCNFMADCETFFVFRMKKDSRFLKVFRNRKLRTVEINLNSNIENAEPLIVRVVRFRLPDGQYEYLVTNLLDRSYKVEMFRELYFMRWPVETKYKQIKSRFQLESFSGYCDEAIDQDFLLAVFFANLTEILRGEADVQIERIMLDDAEYNSSPQQRKYSYRSGEAVIASRLKLYFPEVLVGVQDALSACEHILAVAIQKSNWVQVISGRHYARTVKQPARKFCYNRKPCF